MFIWKMINLYIPNFFVAHFWEGKMNADSTYKLTQYIMIQHEFDKHKNYVLSKYLT